MKQISLPKSALLALLQTGECVVKKPVAKSPAIQAAPIECEWYYKADSYGYENTEALLFGFYEIGQLWIFPWGGPSEMAEIKGTNRKAEIMAVEVVAARKRYQWAITLRLFFEANQ